MAKTVQDRRLALVIELTKEGTDPIEVSCRADYVVSCSNCGEEIQKSMTEVELTPTQETAIKGFANQVLQKIKALEE